MTTTRYTALHWWEGDRAQTGIFTTEPCADGQHRVQLPDGQTVLVPERDLCERRTDAERRLSMLNMYLQMAASACHTERKAQIID
jgi:hypothetical protein